MNLPGAYSSTVGSTQNMTVIATTVNAFQCPSDQYPGTHRRHRLYQHEYGGFQLLLQQRHGPPVQRQQHHRAVVVPGREWQRGRVLTLANVVDGTSNSVVFSEIVKGNSGANKPLPNVVDGSPATGVGAAGSDQLDYQACMKAPDTSLWDYKGEYWHSQDAGRGGTYSHTMPPNTKSCNYGTAYDNRICAGSAHSGGVNMTFLDGSVKFIKNSINYTTYLAIGTIAGTEVFGADQL